MCSTWLELPPLYLYHQEVKHWVMTNKRRICYHTFSAMVDDVEAPNLVRECRELEERYKSDFTSRLLNANAYGLKIIRTTSSKS